MKQDTSYLRTKIILCSAPGAVEYLSQTCHRLLDEPWRHLKKTVFGLEDQPLHASEILRVATEEQRSKLLGFFSTVSSRVSQQ
jgi:hypothetical protein